MFTLGQQTIKCFTQMNSITLLMQHTAENDLFEMHILPPSVLKKKVSCFSTFIVSHVCLCFFFVC